METEVGGISGRKREHERVGFYGLVKVAVANGKEMDVFSENVSLGGIFLRSSRPLPIGQKVALDFETEQGRVRVPEGEVKWNQAFGMFEMDGTPGMGVQFGKMESDSQRIIGAFVDEVLNTQVKTTNVERTPKQILDYPTQIERNYQPQPSTVEFQLDTVIEPEHELAQRLAKALDEEATKRKLIIQLRKRAKPAALGLLFSSVIMLMLFNPFRKSNELVSTDSHPMQLFEKQSVQPRAIAKDKSTPGPQKQPAVRTKSEKTDRIEKRLQPERLSRPVFRRYKADWIMELVVNGTTRIKHYTLTKPYRLVVDFFQTNWVRETKMRPKVPFIKRARFGNQPQKARLVLDFRGNKVPSYKVARKDDRIVIQFQKITE